MQGQTKKLQVIAEIRYKNLARYACGNCTAAVLC